MSGIEQVDASNAEEAVELLCGFDNPAITRDRWRQAVRPPWQPPSTPSGLAVRDGGEMVAFVGTLFSERVIRGRTERFCNLHSLIVRESHRRQGARLMLRAIRIEDHTVTILTPIRSVFETALRVGFRTLDERLVVLPPSPRIPVRPSGRSNPEFMHDPAQIRLRLDADDRQRLDDHASLRCGHLLLTYQGRACYVVYMRAPARIPYAYVLYMSDPELFCRFSGDVRTAMLRRTKTTLAAVDARLLRGHSVPWSLQLPIAVRRVYRSDRLFPEDVDNLYSEFPLLNVGATPSLWDMMGSIRMGSIRRPKINRAADPLSLPARLHLSQG